MHDATPYSREDSLYECMRYHVVPLLYCPVASAEPILLVQEIQSAKVIDLACFKTFPIKTATCLQEEPMSLDWPVDPIARFDQSRPSSSPEDPIDEQQRGALPASTRSRWRQDTLQPPQVLQVLQVGMHVAIFLKEVCGVLLGTPEVSLDLCFSTQKNREFKLKYLKRFFDANNIICLQEVHGMDEYLQAIQVLAPRFFRYFHSWK